MKSWTKPAQGYTLQPLNELNDVELMDLDKKDYVKFKKEFEKIEQEQIAAEQKKERIEKLKEIAKDTVDITGIGFYSLGKHRKNLSKEQLENYKIVFEAYFLKSFSSRLAEYSNPEIEVNSKNIINANYTIVSSTLVATDSRPEVKIEWRVYTKDPDNLLIRDLIIEGLSLARTQKEEFSSIINSNDGKIEALLKNLSDFSAK